MKLERLALIAEIVSGIAIVITLIVLVVEVRDNTSAVRAETRQSLAERVERITMTVATDDELADLVTAAASGDFELVDDLRVRAFVTAILRNTEEAFLQVQEGRLEPGYFAARLQGVLFVLANGATNSIYADQKAEGLYDREFTNALDGAIESWRRQEQGQPHHTP